MKDFVRITPDGNFALTGQRWMCHSAVYFGRYPGDMEDWLTDRYWPLNQPHLARDFAQMAESGINHAAVFLKPHAFFADGKPIEQGYARLDTMVEAAKRSGVRVSLFVGDFIENPAMYRMITGRDWEHGNRWLPSFNPALADAYVQQVAPLARRYRNEPTVLAYTDRIDRFYKGFDNLAIPFNLKEE
jgi:hypothetical protein